MWQKSKAIGPVLAWLAFMFLSFGAMPLPALDMVQQQDGQLCDMAAARAAERSAVPLSILQSIARVESGTLAEGQVVGWPWAINSDGKGYFFSSKTEAMDFAAQLIGAQNINFDVGCFQVNLRWHSKGFTSLEDAFDPMSNAAYAAGFLAQLYSELGNWSDAVAAYHSRSPEHAEPYLTKVKSVWQQLQEDGPPDPVPPPLEPRQNGFPLLLAGEGANGSLVPQGLNPAFRFSLR